MATFKDKSGNDWTVKLTVLNAEHLRENISPPLLITDPESLALLLDSPGQQFQCVWELVRAQAEAKKIDAEQFAELFTDAYADAAKALREALENFFRSIGKAEFVEIVASTSSALEKLQSMQVAKIRSPKAQAVLEANVERASREIDSQYDRMLKDATADLKPPETETTTTTQTPSPQPEMAMATVGPTSGDLPAS